MNRSSARAGNEGGRARSILNGICALLRLCGGRYSSLAWKQLRSCRMRNPLIRTNMPRAVIRFLVLLIAGTFPQLHAQTTQTVTITSVVPQVLSLAINTNAVTMSFLTTDYNTSTGAATKT